MITKDEALVLLRKYLKTENTIKHLLATEAIMRLLAKRFEPEKEEEWALAGLLHDVDYEQDLGKDYEKHGAISVEILAREIPDLSPSIVQAIKAHCWNLNKDWEPKNKMDWSLFISDSLTGLIVATVLVHPDRKLSSINSDSVLRKFKDKAFARGTRREDIALCEKKLGISLKEFIEIGLEAMGKISKELGL